MDAKNTINLFNFITFFDNQNVICIRKNFKINVVKFKLNIIKDNNNYLTHVGWSYNNLIFTYINPNNNNLKNNNLEIIFNKLKENNNNIILGDLNLNNNNYVNNFFKKYNNFEFIGENTYNLGIIKDKNNKKIELKNSIKSLSDHDILIYYIKDTIKVTNRLILDKKTAKNNSILIAQQILNYEPVNFEDKYKKINYIKLPKNRDNTNLICFNLLIDTINYIPWASLKSYFYTKKREEFYGINVSKNIIIELINQTYDKNYNFYVKLDIDKEIKDIINIISHINNNKFTISDKERTYLKKNDKNNILLNLSRLQDIIKYDPPNFNNISPIFPSEGNSIAPDYNGIITSYFIKEIKKRIRYHGNNNNTNLLGALFKVFKTLLESKNLTLLFKIFYLKKKENINNLDDLRVIYITPITIKFFETFTYEITVAEIGQYINYKKVHQFGFLKYNSIYDVLNIINKYQLKENEVIILLDLKRAFDSVVHKFLYQAAEKDEIFNKFASFKILRIWLFLLGKSKRISNNVTWQANIGLPMGLKLSPIFFNLYYYYIIKDIISKYPLFVAYADDTTIVFRLDSLINDFNELENKLNVFNIKLNYNKSHIITNNNIDNNDNIKELTKKGLIKVEKSRLLGKIIQIKENNLIGDFKQIEDFTKYSIYKFEKYPLRIQIRIINAFITGKYRHLFISSGDNDKNIRNYYINNNIEYFKRTIYFKNIFKEEELILIILFNIIKIIITSIDNYEIDNLIWIKNSDEILNNISKIVKEFFWDFNTEFIEENGKKLDKYIRKHRGDYTFGLRNKIKNKITRLMKEEIKNQIFKKINTHDTKIKPECIFDIDIIKNKIFWFALHDFKTSRANKRINNNNGSIILNFLKILSQTIYDDLVNNNECKNIIYYINKVEVRKKFSVKKKMDFIDSKASIRIDNDLIEAIEIFRNIKIELEAVNETILQCREINRENLLNRIDKRKRILKFKKLCKYVWMTLDIFLEKLFAKQRDLKMDELKEELINVLLEKNQMVMTLLEIEEVEEEYEMEMAYNWNISNENNFINEKGLN